jgi:hypothetical protein
MVAGWYGDNMIDQIVINITEETSSNESDDDASLEGVHAI